jgi:hypothetical protein
VIAKGMRDVEKTSKGNAVEKSAAQVSYEPDGTKPKIYRLPAR